MKYIFAPGCALILYKPDLVEKMHSLLNVNLGNMNILSTCCRKFPELEPDTMVINICPGCDRRYRENYDGGTISLWEILAEGDFFDYPDYKGVIMTINDACPTRTENHVHDAVRKLLANMNIKVIEPEKTRTNGKCCGDTGWGKIPTERVLELMRNRASEMPVDAVVVYCVTCAQSMFIGERQPHYLVDLLFGEETVPKNLDIDDWHREIDEYMDSS